ncbi:mRNA export factor [Strigomonas culicis]|uniref:mRNA export factor n=1 Tax=Strigomonas culicis TaxID=28005 RepID=S9TTU4_9TRYP|nr:mRNA export factor [Strigomonas culicis]|eukprot:EPY19979.1 mRNA export factor [Strigomonas culicis]
MHRCGLLPPSLASGRPVVANRVGNKMTARVYVTGGDGNVLVFELHGFLLQYKGVLLCVVAHLQEAVAAARDEDRHRRVCADKVGLAHDADGLSPRRAVADRPQLQQVVERRGLHVDAGGEGLLDAVDRQQSHTPLRGGHGHRVVLKRARHVPEAELHLVGRQQLLHLCEPVVDVVQVHLAAGRYCHHRTRLLHVHREDGLPEVLLLRAVGIRRPGVRLLAQVPVAQLAVPAASHQQLAHHLRHLHEGHAADRQVVRRDDRLGAAGQIPADRRLGAAPEEAAAVCREGQRQRRRRVGRGPHRLRRHRAAGGVRVHVDSPHAARAVPAGHAHERHGAVGGRKAHGAHAVLRRAGEHMVGASPHTRHLAVGALVAVTAERVH